MPKQYERHNSDVYFHKSVYNAKDKNNYLNYLDQLNKKSIDNAEKKNENFENESFKNDKQEACLNSFVDKRENFLSSYNQGNKSSRNKKSDNFNLSHQDSIKEKDLFRKTTNPTAFKKLDNLGLEYFKVNSKTNNPIKIKCNNSNDIINYHNNLNQNKDGSEPKSLLASLKTLGLEYKRLINDSHTERAENPHLIPNPKLIGREMLKSDIFFQKGFSFKENYKIKNNLEKFNSNLSESNLINKNFLNNTANNFNSPSKFDPNKYRDSDIFLLKNNENSIAKIGEKHLLRETSTETIKNKFNITSRSNSEWAPKNKIVSLMNHESTNYDIFNAQMKKKFLTKTDIISMANGSNPNKIQKCISEIIDLTRVGVPNANKEYLKAFENDSTVFRKHGNIGESFFNLHKEYRNICDKPFAKKLV